MNDFHMTHHMISHSMLLHIPVRWLDLIGTIVLVGGLVSRYLVFQPSVAAADLSYPQQAALGKQTERYSIVMTTICLLFLVTTGLVDIVLRAQMMSKRPLFELPSIFPVILLKTHLGRVWIVKFVLWVALGWIAWCKRPSKVITLGLSGLLCLTLSLSGHAADKGDFSLDLLVDWFHLLAVSAWIGGLLHMRLLMPGLLNSARDDLDHRLLTETLGRYSILAGVCIGILIPTGVLSSWLRGVSVASLTETTYGWTLAVKLSIVLPVLGLGALSRYYILPALRSTNPPVLGRFLSALFRLVISLPIVRRMYRHRGVKAFLALPVQNQFFRFMTLEFILALGVLLCAAILTQAPPPHQMGF